MSGQPSDVRSRGWHTRDATTIAAAVLIAVQVVVRVVLLARTYFWQDDFYHLSVARSMGLSADYLLRDYNDHVEVGPFFIYWVVAQFASTSFWPAAISILLLQLIASCLMWALLRSLFGKRPALLLPFAIYLFTPLMVAVVTWWAAALEALSLQCAMLGCLLGMVRFYQSHRWRWAVFSWAALALGLLFWEKSIAVAPLTVAVFLVVVVADRPWRSRLRELLRWWRLWLGYLVLVGGYAALYVLVVDRDAAVQEREGSYLDSIRVMVFEVFVPGLFGGPWSASGALNTIYPHTADSLQIVFAVAGAMVIIASFLVSGRGAMWPWLLLGGYLSADLALMVVSRSQFLLLVTGDPRYLADAIPVAVIMVCAAFCVPRVREHRSRVGARLARLDTFSVSVSATSVLVASSVITTAALAPVIDREYPRNFTNGVVRNIASHPGASIVNTDVPQPISGLVDYRHLLAAVGEDITLDQPGNSMYMFDSLAELREIEVKDPTVSERGPAPDCGWAIHETPIELTTVPAGDAKGRVLRVGYITGVDGKLHVRLGEDEQSLPVTAGFDNAWFVFPDEGGALEAWMTGDDDSGMCITDVEMGTPWPAG